MKPYYEDNSTVLYMGDCVEVMAGMEENSIDAIVTDPPYGLEFMGKEWDKLDKAHMRQKRTAELADPIKAQYLRHSVEYVYKPQEVQRWHQAWAEQALRVLKPGGHMLVAGIGRTMHRMMCGIEDAGFEPRDVVMHVFGSGFPKSLDVGKAIDKRRNDDIRPVCRFLRIAIEASDWTLREVANHFGFHYRMIEHWAARETDSQPSVPTWEQWVELKRLLSFGGEMGDEVWRLNGRKGKPGDNWEKREVIGQKTAGLGSGKTYAFQEANAKAVKDIDITVPATPEAQQWDGWGTALKPAWEVWAHFTKPLTAVPEDVKIIAETTLLLEVLLWLLAPVKFVEMALRLNSGDSKEDLPDSAQWIAAVLGILGSPEKLEATAIFSSPEEAEIFWSIASSWSNILATLCTDENMSIISTETSLITGLKTLNSFLLLSIPAEAIQAVFSPDGQLLDVASVAGTLNSAGQSWKSIPKRFALGDAGWPFVRTVLTTLVSIAVESSLPIRMKSVDSVPELVMTNTEQNGDAMIQSPTDLSKPAWEVWVLFRKPLSEKNVALNVLKWGTGGINIGGSRIGTTKDVPASGAKIQDGAAWGKPNPEAVGSGFDPNIGRWPANFILSHSPECRQVGIKRVKSPGGMGIMKTDGFTPGQSATGQGGRLVGNFRADPDGKETVEAWECAEDCPVRMLGDPARFFKVVDNSVSSGANLDNGDDVRLRYMAKASKKERRGSRHPTVKPLKLMEYLVRLITPPGGLVLDPFCGSGTTGEAARLLGLKATLIEKDEDSVGDTLNRLGHTPSPSLEQDAPERDTTDQQDTKPVQGVLF